MNEQTGSRDKAKKLLRELAVSMLASIILWLLGRVSWFWHNIVEVWGGSNIKAGIALFVAISLGVLFAWLGWDAAKFALTDSPEDPLSERISSGLGLFLVTAAAWTMTLISIFAIFLMAVPPPTP
mgnify:CR=1 FL=1